MLHFCLVPGHHVFNWLHLRLHLGLLDLPGGERATDVVEHPHRRLRRGSLWTHNSPGSGSLGFITTYSLVF